MRDVRPSAIILAGGLATRAGGDKLQRCLGDRPVLQHVIDTFFSAGLDDLIVVTGANPEAVRSITTSSVRTVHNNNFLSGMSSSICCGLRALSPSIETVFITPADIPLFSSQTLKRLRQAIGRHAAAIPVYEGKKGHPVLLTRKAADRCLTIASDRVLYDTLEEMKSSKTLVDVDDPGILLDFDNEEDFQRLEQYFNAGHGLSAKITNVAPPEGKN